MANEKSISTSTVSIDSKKLKRIVIGRLVLFLVALGCMLFVPAGTLKYWEAWLYLTVLFLPASCTMLYMLKHDPELMERRMKMKEKQTAQKNIMKWTYAFFLLAFLVPGLDMRFSWSSVPGAFVIAANCFILAGYLMFVMVLRENRYASRIIEVVEKQKVITTGPYSYVRHPMYTAVLLIWGFTPLALGSYWALIPFGLLIFAVVVARIMNEEKVLLQQLDGYSEYVRKTRFRLIPGIW